MRLLNETRTIVLSSTPQRTVEARVRVRGLDVDAALPPAMRARMGIDEETRRFHIERQNPLDVIVREAGEERHHRIAAPSGRGMAIMFVAAPLAARVIARMFKRGRSR